MNSLNVEMFNEALKIEKQQNWDAAIELYDEILKDKPDHFETWLNRGALFFKKGNAEEAIKSYDKALTLKRDVRALYNLGLVYYKSKKSDMALKYLLECILLNEAFLPACLLTAYIFTDQNNLDKAIQILQKALCTHKGNESLLVSLAIAYNVSKKEILCNSVIHKILEINPRNKAALKLQARISIKESVTKKSIENFRNLMKDDSDIDKIESYFEDSNNKNIKEIILKRKNDIIHKTKKTNNDYFNLSLISLMAGNGDAAMNYLLYAVKDQP
ncbi:MAG: tetratricopeptide repeat protein [Spirochaetia bacterium]|nr:tetratricopeptide repeat protein [Spirochaetia bacterium]